MTLYAIQVCRFDIRQSGPWGCCPTPLTKQENLTPLNEIRPFILEEKMKSEIVEVCPHCEHENQFMWDIEKNGYQARCEKCGADIMLCDECMHADDNPNHRCDWNEDTNCFRKPFTEDQRCITCEQGPDGDRNQQSQS